MFFFVSVFPLIGLLEDSPASPFCGGERSEPEQNGEAGESPDTALQPSRFFDGVTVLFAFLLRREQKLQLLRKRLWWCERVRLILGWFYQSVAQLEPLAHCAPNSNRCLSVGLLRQLVFVRMS